MINIIRINMNYQYVAEISNFELICCRSINISVDFSYYLFFIPECSFVLSSSLSFVVIRSHQGFIRK